MKNQLSYCEYLDSEIANLINVSKSWGYQNIFSFKPELHCAICSTFYVLRQAYTIKFFFHDLEIFISKKSVKIFQKAKCVSWNIIQFVHTIKFYSYDHGSVSFMERINSFRFSSHRYYSFKCLKILKKRSKLRSDWGKSPN